MIGSGGYLWKLVWLMEIPREKTHGLFWIWYFIYYNNDNNCKCRRLCVTFGRVSRLHVCSSCAGNFISMLTSTTGLGVATAPHAGTFMLCTGCSGAQEPGMGMGPNKVFIRTAVLIRSVVDDTVNLQCLYTLGRLHHGGSPNWWPFALGRLGRAKPSWAGPGLAGLCPWGGRGK